jgi:hypothetical protein
MRRAAALTTACALLAGLTVLAAASPASADTDVETNLRCRTAIGGEFNLPMFMSGTAFEAGTSNVISSVLGGDPFDAELTARLLATETWLQGALITVYETFGVIPANPSTGEVTATIEDVTVPIPVPAGATGTTQTIVWDPGVIVIGTANPAFNPATYVPGAGAGNGLNQPMFAVPGGVSLPNPTPVTTTYDTSAVAADTDIEFEIDPSEPLVVGGANDGLINIPAAPVKMTVTLPGLFPLAFGCVTADEILDTNDPPGPPTPIPGGNPPFLTVTATAPPAPTADISDVTGQSVTDAARTGNVISFEGGNWTPVPVGGTQPTITAELCSLDLSSCDPGGLTGLSASIDDAGVISGSATVDSSATTGARVLLVTAGAEEDETPAEVLILAAPQIGAPTNAGVGAPILIEGTNWNPDGADPISTVVELRNSNGTLGNPLDDTVLQTIPVAVDGLGGFSTSANVPAGLDLIVAGDGDPFYPTPPLPGSMFAFSPFTVSANGCTVVNPVIGCSIEQTVLLTTVAGSLSMSQQTGIVDFGSLQLDGLAHVEAGAINEITVIDSTGSLNGWDVTATMTDLVTGSGVGNRRIPAANMEWTPSCDPIDANSDGIVDGDPTEVFSGSGPVAMHNTLGNTLCTAPVEGGGGTYTGNAALELLVPANVAAGSYSATISFLLI